MENNLNTAAGLKRLNDLPLDELVDALFDACHLPVRAWAEAVAAGRPFADLDAVVATAQHHVDDLTPEQVISAHDGLTRIGARITGTDAEARWSRQEAAGVREDNDTAARLTAANEAYEARHGHVFLISATGLTSDQIIDEIERRRALDDAEETAQIKVELRKLVAIRLPKLLAELAAD